MTPWKDGYRTAFPLAALTGVIGVGVWVAALLGVGAPADPIQHATVLLWGLLGTGVVGFLLTAYPRQNDAAQPDARLIQAFVGVQALTTAGLLLGWFGGSAGWGAPAGTIATVSGVLVWGGLTLWAARIAAPSLRRKWDDTTAGVPLALAGATAGWALVRLGPDPRLGLDFGVHAFLVPLALLLLDRLVVFFSSRAAPGYTGTRARGFGTLLLLGIMLRLATREAPRIADTLLAVVLLRQLLGWRPWTTVRIPMVAILHTGVLWILAGYLLQAAWPGVPPSLPGHLWLLGGMLTLLFGISMRVTLGHGNQPIRMLPAGWGVWGLGSLALVLRIGGALAGGALPLYIAAGVALVCALLLWLQRYTRIALGA